MEEKNELSVIDVKVLTDKKEVEELEKKINEIEEKIKKKVELVLTKEDIDFMDYQILNSHILNLKSKIEDVNRKDSNEHLINLVSSMLNKNI